MHWSTGNPVAFLYGIDMRLHISGKESPIVLARFHHHSEVRQLRSTLVDIQPPQVILDDLGSGLTRRVTIILINTDKYVKENAKYMAGAHTWINDAYFFRLQSSVFFAYGIQLRLYLRLLFCLVQIIFPLRLQSIIRMSL